jgi:hypothetical protein
VVVVGVLVGVVCLGLGVGAGLVISPAPVPEVLAPAVGDSVVSVVARDFDDPRTLPVTPVASRAVELVAGGSGVVRSTRCEVGLPVASGDSVVMVDDTWVMALELKRPMWRDLWPGMSGDDVTRLQRVLKDLGFELAANGKFDAATVDAVAGLWDRAGQSGRKTFVRMADVLWLRQGEITPSKCPLRMGDTVSPETVVVQSGGVLERLELKAADGMVEGAREALMDDQLSGPIGDELVVTDQGLLDWFAKTKGYLEWVKTGQSEGLTLNTVLTQPVEVVAVPAAALYRVKGATGCVLAPDEPVAVRIVASQLGETMVTAAGLPERVRLYPGEDAGPCE